MKHTNAHKLDVACLDCVKVHLEHKELLIGLVRDFVHCLDLNLEVQANSALHHCAKDLLDKIKEIE